MNLFVYGTLRAFPLMEAVGGDRFRHAPATLDHYQVTGVVGDVVPTIFAEIDGQAEGLLLRNVTPAAMARFDLFEMAWDYTRHTVTVQTADGPKEAEFYLPPEGQNSNGRAWSLQDWEAQNCAAVTDAAKEMFARDPLPDEAGFASRWPMALSRAWARTRARTRRAPTSLRSDHNRFEDGSVAAIRAMSPPQGSFFALQSFEVSHQRFDGQGSGVLPREVFLGVDAALVLPYDPVSDRVLLVEQIRMGPLRLGEPNPWVLEPVAGIVDAGETPEAAALREAAEEAGLEDMVLEPINSFYPSPGASTDFFYCYLGLTTLADRDAYSGGLAAEHEDLRLHTIPFARAMDLARTGEIGAGPLLAMLYWLALNRDRLRA